MSLTKMIKSNDIRKIKSPDYATSQERLNVLRNIVIDGEDAQAVKKYTETFLKECASDVLKYAEEGKTELMNEAALDYKVACRFCRALEYAADLGAKKEKILQRNSLQ